MSVQNYTRYAPAGVMCRFGGQDRSDHAGNAPETFVRGLHAGPSARTASGSGIASGERVSVRPAERPCVSSPVCIGFLKQGQGNASRRCCIDTSLDCVDVLLLLQSDHGSFMHRLVNQDVNTMRLIVLDTHRSVRPFA